MNLSDIILQFARGAKNAQIILNEKTGDAAADIPMVIKEAEFKYLMKCSLDFSQSVEVQVQWFASVKSNTTVTTNQTEELDIRILFQNHMLVVSEANK